MRKCSVEGCERKHGAKGLCRMHYSRKRRNGHTDPLYGLSLKERFHANYIPEPMSGCWLWVGGTNGKGYGQLWIDGEPSIMAHRLSWELHNGPIPKGMLVCHKCDTPPCVNPDHLFIGTDKDNIQDCIKKGRYVYNIKNLKRGRRSNEHMES